MLSVLLSVPVESDILPSSSSVEMPTATSNKLHMKVSTNE